MRPRNIDRSQPAIVEALRAVGAEVESLARYGMSCDLLVQKGGRLWLMEVKNEDDPPSRQKLTDREVQFARRFPVALVRSPAEALAVIGVFVQ